MKYTLKIWDTAGQEKFYSIGKTFYNGVNGIVIAFDLSEAGAIKKLNGWLSKLKENIDSTAIPIVIAGTKCDLKNIQVKKEAINVIASLHKTKYFETSAKNNINVDEAFQYLTEEIIRRKSEDNDENNTAWQYIAAPVNATGLETGADTIHTITSLEIEFKWGSFFGGEAPSTFYNGLSLSTVADAKNVEDELDAMKTALTSIKLTAELVQA